MSTIQEIFDRDPLSLTKEDRAVLIGYYRQARANFALGDKSAGSTKKATAKGPKITTLDIEDLL